MKTHSFRSAMIISLLLLSGAEVFAQLISFQFVTGVARRNSGYLYQGNDISGYYLFYMVDKVDKQNRSYLLTLMDKNLNKIATKEMVDSKYMHLQEGAYNGQSIMLKFWESKEQKVLLRKFDSEAKITSTKTILIENKKELNFFYTGSDADVLQGDMLFAVPGKGYVNYTVKHHKNLGYQIDFIGETDANKNWTYNSSATAPMEEIVSYIGLSYNILLNTVAKRKNMNSPDAEYYVQAIDINTGKLMYEKLLEDVKYEVQPINGFISKDGNEAIIMGSYFTRGEKSDKAKSLGLATIVVDNSGKFTSTTYTSWAKDVAKFLDVSERGKIEDVGYIFFHHVVRTPDDKIYAIGEQYKKVPSAAGIVGKALQFAGGGQSTKSVVDIRIEDMTVFTFNTDRTLAGVEFYDKAKTTHSLPYGTGVVSGPLLAQMIKYTGGFDYYFTQVHKDPSVFTVGYMDYVKNEEAEKRSEKRQWIFGSITRTPEGFKTNKLPLKSEASSLTVYPAKPGYIAISEYYKKEKKLDYRLEKINF